MRTDVIDVSHHNDPSIQLHGLKAAGVKGIFIKVSQGQSFLDPNAVQWLQRSLEVDFLIGLYHFGDNSDPAGQLANFQRGVAKLAEAGLKTFVSCIDFERSGDTMSKWSLDGYVRKHAVAFGAVPTLYGSDLAAALVCSIPGVFAWPACPIWRAKYGANQPGPFGWGSHIPYLWQFTDSGPGGIDESEFLLTTDTLEATWERLSVQAC